MLPKCAFMSSNPTPPHLEKHSRTTIYDFLLQNVREITAENYMKRLRQLGQNFLVKHPLIQSAKEVISGFLHSFA
jgi:hypothetical protein